MRFPVLLVLVLLAGCKDEPRFDDRYDKVAQEIDARAKAMDAEIAKSDQSQNGASGDLPRPAEPSNPPASSGE